MSDFERFIEQAKKRDLRTPREIEAVNARDRAIAAKSEAEKLRIAKMEAATMLPVVAQALRRSGIAFDEWALSPTDIDRAPKRPTGHMWYSGPVPPAQWKVRRYESKFKEYFNDKKIGLWDMIQGTPVTGNDSESGEYTYHIPLYLGEDGSAYVGRKWRIAELGISIGNAPQFETGQVLAITEGLANLVVRHELKI